jgi:hypothetical protein
MTVYTASQKLPKGINVQGGPQPWVEPWLWQAQQNAGMAGKMTHQALESSRGSMGLGNKI